MAQDVAFLMYHELQRAGRPLCDNDPGYTRYVVSEATFQSHLSRIKATGSCGLNITQALNGQAGVAITFDDGPESDLLIAAPALTAAGYSATFFIVAGWVGRQGFLSADQLVELSQQGFEIGSHGMTHAFLSDLDDAQLRVEITESKERLEAIIGHSVSHLSCPGGRWDARVAKVAREVGYQSVSTSRLGANGPDSDRFRLARMAVTCDTNLNQFDRLCRGELSPREKARGLVLGAAKSLLGNGAYQRARGAVLNKSVEGHS